MSNSIIRSISNVISRSTRFVAFRSHCYSSLVPVSATSQPADFVPALAGCFSGSHSVYAEGDTVFVDFI